MLQSILRMLPPLRGALAVKLTGVSGFTGHGSVHYAAMEQGGVLTVSLSGVAGRRADIFADGERAASIAITNGRASATFSSTKGDKLPALADGAHIDIRQNGDIVLSGVLTRV
ncbi:hypothetical protein [Hyphococcus luteus]|nr:hypothetical protein [Marinicaulis flavus]